MHCRYDKFSYDITNALEGQHANHKHDLLVQIFDPTGKTLYFLPRLHENPQYGFAVVLVTLCCALRLLCAGQEVFEFHCLMSDV